MRCFRLVVLLGAAWVGTPQARAGVFVLTNNTPGIFDGSSGTRSVTVTGTEPGFGTGVLVSVTVAIDYLKADGEGPAPPPPPPLPGSPFFNEIVFRVDRAGFPSTTLIAANTYSVGDAGDFFSGVQTFATGAPAIPLDSEPAAGTFSPTGPGSLAAYNGSSALGVWTLFIQDTVGLDALRFRSVTFTFTTQDAPAAVIPEPASCVLLGVGAAGLVGYRRRRRHAG
jgi:hypothetical protein